MGKKERYIAALNHEGNDSAKKSAIYEARLAQSAQYGREQPKP